MRIVLALLLLISQSLSFGEKSGPLWDAYKQAVPFINYLDATTLPAHLATKIPTLIFFGAEWCTHCQKLTPIWLKYQQEMESKAKVFAVKKVECEENKELCKDIDGFPTIKYYLKGELHSELDLRTFDDLMAKYYDDIGNRLNVTKRAGIICKAQASWWALTCILCELLLLA